MNRQTMKQFLLSLLCIISILIFISCDPTGSIPNKPTIDSFRFDTTLNPALSEDVNGIISGDTISVTVPFGTDVSALTPSISHNGVNVNPYNGLTLDFTNPINYVVTAEDGSTQSYTVTVSIALITKAELKEMILNGDNVTDIDTSGITDMSSLFYQNTTFNQDISGWDVSHVTDMNNMFNRASAFNQDISGWIVNNVTNMSGMFQYATSFNQNISGWTVSNVTDMKNMFDNAESFNGNISGWVVSNVTDMSFMFRWASAFNQDISGWDVSNVTNMDYMFTQAAVFNQNISEWSSHILESTPHTLFSYSSSLLTAYHPYSSWDD